jgi:hypothetical protein
MQKSRKGSGLDNLQIELLKFRVSELKAHILGLFNNIGYNIQIPKEWQTGELIKRHKNGQNVKAKITE